MACPLTVCLSSALAALGGALVATCAPAVAADRDFAATILVDDPAAGDELSLPTFARLTRAEGTREMDLSAELSKRVTERLALSVATSWSQISSSGSGLQNLSSTLKHMSFIDEVHEFVLSTGLSVEWGGTGAARVGSDPFNTYSPEIYFGKGFGDLPADVSALRPLAVTGQAGFVIPGRSSTRSSNAGGGPADFDFEQHPILLKSGLTIQYSLPYANANVSSVGGPELLRHLTPLVEIVFEIPVSKVAAGRRWTTAVAAPGVVYSSGTWQLALEAIVPLNDSSGKHIGAMAQLHFALDALLPAIREIDGTTTERDGSD